MYMVCNGVTMDDKRIKMIGGGIFDTGGDQLQQKWSGQETRRDDAPSAVIQQVFHTLAKKGGKKEQSKVRKHGSELL